MLHKILSWCGAVGLLRFISSFFARLAGTNTPPKTVISSVQRHAVQAILQDTHDEGILSSVQTDIINRLVKIANVHIKSVMIPIDKVLTVNTNSDNSALLNILKEHSFTRLPVIDTQTGTITGFINIYEALSSSKEFSNLQDIMKPIIKIDAETTVTDAINFMQAQKQKILLVIKGGRAGKEKPLGIVTMKDLVEELLGELAEW
jgi:CBS domain containing-hemolysin-like protein